MTGPPADPAPEVDRAPRAREGAHRADRHPARGPLAVMVWVAVTLLLGVLFGAGARAALVPSARVLARLRSGTRVWGTVVGTRVEGWGRGRRTWATVRYPGPDGTVHEAEATNWRPVLHKRLGDPIELVHHPDHPQSVLLADPAFEITQVVAGVLAACLGAGWLLFGLYLFVEWTMG